MNIEKARRKLRDALRGKGKYTLDDYEWLVDELYDLLEGKTAPDPLEMVRERAAIVARIDEIQQILLWYDNKQGGDKDVVVLVKEWRALRRRLYDIERAALQEEIDASKICTSLVDTSTLCITGMKVLP